MHTGSRDHGVGSPDHFSRHAKQNGNEMKQVMNHNKDNGLLNMIRRTDTMIFTFFLSLPRETQIMEFDSTPVCTEE